jgi:hypothetical protein
LQVPHNRNIEGRISCLIEIDALFINFIHLQLLIKPADQPIAELIFKPVASCSFSFVENLYDVHSRNKLIVHAARPKDVTHALPCHTSSKR